MSEAIKIDRENLLHLLVKTLSNGKDVKLVGGINPCLIRINDEDCYFFIKNLSPAQLSNDNHDIWRIQLPIKKEFEAIKKSSIPFILLGYDGVNDVYASWNPYWIKQRLNIGKSISLYSRLSLQKSVSANQDIEYKELNHSWKVVCFPRTKLNEYLSKIKDFFPVESTYVPIGSSIETKKKKMEKLNDRSSKLFGILSSMNNFWGFSKFMKEQAVNRNGIRYSNTTSNHYIAAIRFVFDNNLWNKYESIFSDAQYLDDYSKSMELLLLTPELKKRNIDDHRTTKNALSQYLDYLKATFHEFNRERSIFEKPKARPEIIDPSLKEKLAPLMNREDPDTFGALSILSDYYGDTYNDVMEFKDWIDLLNNTNWKTGASRSNKSEDVDNERRKTTTLKITYTDSGKVVCAKHAVDVFTQTIKDWYPDLIVEMGIRNGGTDLITKEKIPGRSDQKDLGDGYFLTTRSSTEDKAKILRKIFNELDIKATVEVIPSSLVK